MLTNPTLKAQVDSLRNRFWSGGISNPLTAIEKMSYLIFLHDKLFLNDTEMGKVSSKTVPSEISPHFDLHKDSFLFFFTVKRIFKADSFLDKFLR